MDKDYSEIVKRLINESIEKQLSDAVFGNTVSTTSGTSTPPLTYENMLDLINKIPPVPENRLDFDQIRISKTGWETMKKELQIEEKQEYGIISFMGCRVLIREYIPDNMAIATKESRKEGKKDKIVAIIYLGFPMQKLKIP
jgi:hypothetical protein